MLSCFIEGLWIHFYEPLPPILLSFKEWGQGVRFEFWRIMWVLNRYKVATPERSPGLG